MSSNQALGADGKKLAGKENAFPQTFQSSISKLKLTLAELPELAIDLGVLVLAEAKANAELIFPPLFGNGIGK